MLFICRANAGRSQMAEGFYNALTGTENATSAGIDLLNSVKGVDPSVPELVVEVMKEVGVDVSAKRRKALTQEMVKSVDMVVVITEYPMPEYVEGSVKLVRWNDVPDAVRTPIEFHRMVRDMVKEKVKALVMTSGPGK